MAVPGPNLILASASPRRSDLLRQIGVVFAVSPVDIDEKQLSGEEPKDFVCRLAVEKARVGFLRQLDADPGRKLPVLGADTIVVCGEEVFGKPENADHAFAMLKALSGTTHCVFSAVAVCDSVKCNVVLSETRVTFRTLTIEEIATYWASGEPQGKAGAYAIQGLGGIFVTRLEGSYSGVVGLPLMETAQLLKEFAVPVWTDKT